MRNVLTIAAAALGVATASSAYGQTQDPDALIPVNVTVRLGVSLPLDNDLRDTGSVFANFGAEYRIDHSLLRNGDTYFALDFFKSNRHDYGYVIPLTLNQRFYTRSLADGRRTYLFGGAGVAWVKGQSDWDATFAVRGGIGAELGDRIIAEGALVLTTSGSNSDVHGNLLSFSIGYRF